MTAILTAKARQLIERGVSEAGDYHHRKVWHSWAQANPDVRGPGQPWEKAAGRLPTEVIATALYVLEYIARGKRQKLERGHLSEDEISDLDNDLTYIKSLERFLLQGVPERV